MAAALAPRTPHQPAKYQQKGQVHPEQVEAVAAVEAARKPTHEIQAPLEPNPRHRQNAQAGEEVAVVQPWPWRLNKRYQPPSSQPSTQEILVHDHRGCGLHHPLNVSRPHDARAYCVARAGV